MSASLEKMAADVSREYWEYVNKIGRGIPGGSRGEQAFLALLAVRRYAEGVEIVDEPAPEPAPSAVNEDARSMLADPPEVVKRGPGRPRKEAA